MILNLQGQGFPEILKLLGVNQPLAGPFWAFESTILPVLNVGSTQVLSSSTPPMENFFTMGQIATPGATATLANTVISNLQKGWHALRLQMFWRNLTAARSEISLQRWNSVGAVQETDYLVVIAPTGTAGENGQYTVDLVLQIPEFGDQWLLINTSALATPGTVVYGSIRTRFLGLPFSDPLVLP